MFLGIGKDGDFCFDGSGDGDRTGAFRSRKRLDPLGMAVAGRRRGFLDVGDIEDRLRRHQVQRFERAFRAMRDVGKARRPAGRELDQSKVHQPGLGLGLLVA